MFIRLWLQVVIRWIFVSDIGVLQRWHVVPSIDAVLLDAGLRLNIVFVVIVKTGHSIPVNLAFFLIRAFKFFFWAKEHTRCMRMMDDRPRHRQWCHSSRLRQPRHGRGWQQNRREGS